MQARLQLPAALPEGTPSESLVESPALSSDREKAVYSRDVFPQSPARTGFAGG